MKSLSRLILLAPVLIALSGCDVFDSKNRNSSLDSLTVSAGSLDPAFSPDTTDYTVTVDAATGTITVSATAQKGKALVSINGESGSRGSASADVALDVGSNTITVVVSAEKRKRQTTYTLVVTRLTPTFSVGGTVSGLSGDLVLQNNGGDDLAISADGSFTFSTPLDDGSTYNVSVASQPAGQECTVTNGAGTVSGADVTDVVVDCIASSFTVGGTLSGLSDSITLQNNGGDDLVLTENGAFTFATPLDDGATYNVTISAQPAGQECTVSNGNGTIDGADVSSVVVACAEPAIKLIGGLVTGLAGTLTLQLNGSSNLLVVTDGTFNFYDQFTGGETYSISVLAQPVNQTCTVSNGNGTIGTGNVLDVIVECTGAGVAAGSIFDWEWVSPTPQGNILSDFASDGTRVVAVGFGGLVQTSTDGSNWTTRDSGTGSLLQAIAWGGGTFVAVGPEGTILTSPDGVTWQVQQVGFKALNAITWTGSRFVAVGTGQATDSPAFGPIVGTSTDGSDWSFQLLSAEQATLQDVASNGSVLVASQVPGNNVFSSVDGVNWTATQVGDSGALLTQLASDGSGFVIASSSGDVFTSPDGETWTQEAESLPTVGASALEWDGSRYVALGQSQIATSADASAWTVNDVTTAATSGPLGLSGFIRHNGQNIIGHVNGAISTSPDDTSWTTPYARNFESLGDVIWHDNQFIAVGQGPSVHTSPDGVNWTTRYSASPQLATAEGIVRGGSQFVVVASGIAEQVLTSPDGVTWTPQTLTTEFLSLQNVAWGNGLFIAVGGGALLTSPDGTTWTDRSPNLDATDFLSDVEWNGSTWVATGFTTGTGSLVGHTWTSPDGITWTRQPALPLPPNSGFSQLSWNGSQFVAAGFTAIGTSPDGLNWSILQSNDQPETVTWTGTEFLLTGASPYLLSSTSGTGWSVQPVISALNGAVASDGSTTVLAGFVNGHIVVNSGAGGP